MPRQPDSPNPCAAFCCILLAVAVLFSLIAAFVFHGPKFSQLGEDLVALSEPDAETAFQQFAAKYEKAYAGPMEQKKRFEIFSFNYGRILKSNRENTHFKLGVNKFADLTDEEFARLYLKKVSEENVERDSEAFLEPAAAAGEEIDHEDKLTEPKDQGNCGSCWSFGALGSIEAAYFIKYGKKVRFAEQQLVDCSINYDNHGCNGGEYANAWEYIKNASEPGIVPESEYPYRAYDQPCQLPAGKQGYHIAAYYPLPWGKPDMMMEILKRQPMAVSVKAGCYYFRFYKEGVVTKDCGQDLDHDVTLVGAGELNGVPYWKIRNSWGKNWGLHGHILVSRSNLNEGNGTFGVQATPGYPIAA